MTSEAKVHVHITGFPEGTKPAEILQIFRSYGEVVEFKATPGNERVELCTIECGVSQAEAVRSKHHMKPFKKGALQVHIQQRQQHPQSQNIQQQQVKRYCQSLLPQMGGHYVIHDYHHQNPVTPVLPPFT
eukprot:GFYU01013050.1.p1 GENE.GFYU01013050.1~~GFYU01013050.1.p1  ORF type:complete len:130 (-),score=18.22 GFYU01013050.1:152-541(-)